MAQKRKAPAKKTAAKKRVPAKKAAAKKAAAKKPAAAKAPATQEKKLSPAALFYEELEKQREEIAKALPAGLSADRFMRTVQTTIRLRPDLLAADRLSLFAALMLAAKDGLLPDGKEATIEIYNKTFESPEGPFKVPMANYMPMVGGMVRKLYEAGCAINDVAVVYKEDHFRFSRGDNPTIEHEVAPLDIEDEGPIIGAYAIVTLPDGQIVRELMRSKDIEQVRLASQQSNGLMWTKWPDQGAIKAVIKRLYKRLPHEVSAHLQSLVDNDNEAMGFDFSKSESPDKPESSDKSPQALTDQRGPSMEGQHRTRRLDKILARNGLNRETDNSSEEQPDGSDTEE